MWDYAAFPLWCGHEHDRAIPDDFRRALQEWSDEGTARFVARFSGEELPVGWIEDWARRGRALAEASTQIVGEVEYWNQATDERQIIEAEVMEDGYPTPEEAALAGFSPAAGAQVVSIDMVNDREARVIVDTVPSHPITSDVRRDLRGRWTEWSAG